MINAVGNGQGECYQCKKEGKFALDWMCFLYETEVDNFKHLYCYNCCKKIEEGEIKIHEKG